VSDPFGEDTAVGWRNRTTAGWFRTEISNAQRL